MEFRRDTALYNEVTDIMEATVDIQTASALIDGNMHRPNMFFGCRVAWQPSGEFALLSRKNQNTIEHYEKRYLKIPNLFGAKRNEAVACDKPGFYVALIEALEKNSESTFESKEEA